MKKIYLLAAMALMMISCSSNDEENLPIDELLAGTEWRYGSFDDDDFLDTKPITEIDVTPDEATIIIDKYFPDIQYTKGEIYLTENRDTTKQTDIYYRAKLIFENCECKYEEENYTTLEIKKIEYKNQTTTYSEQSSTSPIRPDFSIQITKDAITVYQTNPYTSQQVEYLYQPLDNFHKNQTLEKTTSTEYESVCNEITEETFQYQRNGNEVVLTNSNKKWIGTLDTDSWTLSLVQIVPEKKEMPTFSLK